jgi:hypothetical protein
MPLPGRVDTAGAIDDGLEYFVWNNQRSTLCAGGFGGVLGAMGAPDILPHPDLTNAKGPPPASDVAAARVARRDGEGLSKVILYPTLGLLWE